MINFNILIKKYNLIIKEKEIILINNVLLLNKLNNAY
jgi:hypothetical protein